LLINWKTKKYHTVWTFSKFNRKIRKRDKIDISNTQIHDHSLSIQSGGIKLVSWTQIY